MRFPAGKPAFLHERRNTMPRVFYCTCVLAILVSGCAILPVTEGKKDFNEGAALFKKGDCEKASLKFADALRKEPDLREGYVYLAECSLKKGDREAALQSAQQAMAAAAKEAGISSRLKTVLTAGGQSAFDKKEYDLAVRFFKEAVKLEQNDSSLRLWLGKALLERGNQGDMKAAIIEFKTAMNASASPAQDLALIRSALFARAEQYSAHGDRYTQSRCYLAYTENFNPNDIEACIALGKLFSKVGNPVGALYYAQKAYALDPKNKAAIELLGELNSPIHP
jgi:tetratricopeptide (TPR) repeat protein